MSTYGAFVQHVSVFKTFFRPSGNHLITIWGSSGAHPGLIRGHLFDLFSKMFFFVFVLFLFLFFILKKDYLFV